MTQFRPGRGWIVTDAWDSFIRHKNFRLQTDWL